MTSSRKDYMKHYMKEIYRNPDYPSKKNHKSINEQAKAEKLYLFTHRLNKKIGFDHTIIHIFERILIWDKEEFFWWEKRGDTVEYYDIFKKSFSLNGELINSGPFILRQNESSTIQVVIKKTSRLSVKNAYFVYQILAINNLPNSVFRFLKKNWYEVILMIEDSGCKHFFARLITRDGEYIFSWLSSVSKTVGNKLTIELITTPSLSEEEKEQFDKNLITFFNVQNLK